MSKDKFTKEGTIDVQVCFQEIWRRMPIDKRNELFGQFVRVTEFLELLVLVAPSARTPPGEKCTKIYCKDSCV